MSDRKLSAEELTRARSNLAKQRDVYDYGHEGDVVIRPEQWVSTLDAHIGLLDQRIATLESENARLREAHRAISETTEYRNVQTQRDLLNLTKALLDDANRECKELSGLLAEAREHVCSVTCRSYWSPGQPHDPEADHSDLCKRIGAALEPSHE